MAAGDDHVFAGMAVLRSSAALHILAEVCTRMHACIYTLRTSLKA